MDVLPVLLVLIIIVIIVLLALLGTYKDFASRSGIPLSSRRELLVPPTAYAMTVLSVFLPFVLLVIYPLFQMNIAIVGVLVVPLCLLLFCLLVVAGSLALWFAYGRSQAFRKCLQLSARMMLVPVIDSFWSSVAVFITVEYASMALLCGSALATHTLASQPDLQSMIGMLFSPVFGLQFVIFFPLIGVPVAYYIYKHGPSEALSKFYLIIGYAFLVICFIASAYLYSTLGQASSLIVGFLVLFGIITCSINGAISRLYHYLRVTGVFGLELVCFSGLLLFVIHEAEQIRNIPAVGQIIYGLIPNFLWSIGYEVGIIGLVSGVVILVVARNQPEKGQLMTRAMAFTIGISAFLPLLSLIIPIPYVGELMGGFLVFVLVSPLYLLAVSILRVSGAMKTLAGIRKPFKRCPYCGRKNKPHANFCGKCGNHL